MAKEKTIREETETLAYIIANELQKYDYYMRYKPELNRFAVYKFFNAIEVYLELEGDANKAGVVYIFVGDSLDSIELDEHQNCIIKSDYTKIIFQNEKEDEEAEKQYYFQFDKTNYQETIQQLFKYDKEIIKLILQIIAKKVQSVKYTSLFVFDKLNNVLNK